MNQSGTITERYFYTSICTKFFHSLFGPKAGQSVDLDHNGVFVRIVGLFFRRDLEDRRHEFLVLHH